MPVPARPPRGLSRAGLVRFGALAAAGVGGGVALATAASCAHGNDAGSPFFDDAGPDVYSYGGPLYGGPPTPIVCDDVTISSGEVAVSGPCSDNDYVELPSQLCEGVAASLCDFVIPGCCKHLDAGSDGGCLCVTYALCVNGSYSVCSNEVPDGSVRVFLDGAPFDGSFDAETDAPADAASEATEDATPDAAPDVDASGDAQEGG
jgi:hypothetical protein